MAVLDGSCTAAVAPGLTFVQGFRHTLEWAIQATLLQLSADHWLVQESDLLLHTNNQAANMTLLEHSIMPLYPHARKAIINGWRNNSGKRCGLLEAIAGEYWRWRCYEWVLFLHPDLYLLPGAVATLGSALQTHRTFAFLVQPLYLYAKRSLWNTDLFMWRPPLLQQNPSAGQHASNIFDGMCLSREQANGTTLLHGDASPERSLYRAVHAGQLSWCELGGKKAFLHSVDLLGIWHSHIPELAFEFTRMAITRGRSVRALENAINKSLTPAHASDFFKRVQSMRQKVQEPGAQQILRRSRLFAANFSHLRSKSDASHALYHDEMWEDDSSRRWSRCQRHSGGGERCKEKWQVNWGWLCEDNQ